MHARRSYMVVLRGVGVLLVLLLGFILALVQPASAAPALIATEPPRPPDNVQADHAGMADDDSSPSEPAPSAVPATADDGATTQPTPPQDPDPDPSDPEVASSPSAPSVPSASEAPEADAPPAATSTPSSAPSSGLAPATTPTADSSVVVAAVDPEDDGFSDEGNFDDGNISAQAAAAATTMAAAIPSAPSIHTLGGLLAYTGAGLGLTLAMACLLVIGALALWLSRRESETAPAFF